MKDYKYPIGYKFTRNTGKRKNNHIEKIFDIWVTKNSIGDVVKVRYLTMHTFLGQAVIDRDVCAATIARGVEIDTP